jgi:hypothetical protein
MQIVTDNGSNYKKACKMISRKFLIVWQSCLAHTINLMLKENSEGDHYRPGQTYEQRKGKTTLFFPSGQFIFSKYM